MQAGQRTPTSAILLTLNVSEKAVDHLSRSLALVCGLILALPPGWCCMAQPASASKKREKLALADHCSCCPKCGNPDQQESEQAPSKPFRCPCDDRDLSTPVKSGAGNVESLPAALQ